jgi:hypothetical protein
MSTLDYIYNFIAVFTAAGLLGLAYGLLERLIRWWARRKRRRGNPVLGLGWWDLNRR